MYCDKTNVNQLTALLLVHGIKHVVACPGSRNGALVHNFFVANESDSECRETDERHKAHRSFSIYPVTDERSAAFVAVGLCLAIRKPVAVCVTSGSALLNTLPAVAEAYYRYLPLLVISADRPARWIGQLDGQTLPQTGALKPYAATYDLPEPHDDEERGWCNRIINEALLCLFRGEGAPVHINVPISEPLFTFKTRSLPDERMIRAFEPQSEYPLPDELLGMIRSARLPVLLVGQYECGVSENLRRIEEKGCLLVLPEIVSNQSGCWRTCLLENTECTIFPDVVIHIGGNWVNKRFKHLLRKNNNCQVVRIAMENEMPDTFGYLSIVVRTRPENALRQMAELLPEHEGVVREKNRMDALRGCWEHFTPMTFSDVGIMKLLAQLLQKHLPAALHIANSSVVRNAVYFFDGGRFPIVCNRGVNGIEGTLSVAAGYSLACEGITLVLIGDLSFFYDQNALWNTHLRGNLRIVLFNNGGGQIFRRLPGLSETAARDAYIAAGHSCTGQGVASTYGLRYLAAHSYADWEIGARELLEGPSDRPVLLEVFTNQEDNEAEREALNAFYQQQYINYYAEDLEKNQGL